MNALLQELVHAGLYKRTQGRITRQVTFAVLALIIALGFYALSESLVGVTAWVRYGLPAVLTIAGWWIAYRLVNYPPFADFLIAVEAEMNKVSWPTRGELIRACAVVLLVIFLLAILLYGYDFVWWWIFRIFGVI